jgi:hypothetical protein
MDTPNPPYAIHGKAIDEASEGDRIWFEQNPGRRYRLRNFIQFENNGPHELPPFGTTWRVVVTLIREGVRFRMPVALPADLPNEGATDEHLAAIVDQAAPPDFKKVLKAARKDWKKQ